MTLTGVRELPARPAEKDLVVVHVRCMGYEFVGRIHKGQLSDPTKPLAGYLPMFDICTAITMMDPQHRRGAVPLMRWSAGNYWEEPILVPRAQATIAVVMPGGALWNDYAGLLGNMIRLVGNIPKNMPPPPGAQQH